MQTAHVLHGDRFSKVSDVHNVWKLTVESILLRSRPIAIFSLA